MAGYPTHENAAKEFGGKLASLTRGQDHTIVESQRFRYLGRKLKVKFILTDSRGLEAFLHSPATNNACKVTHLSEQLEEIIGFNMPKEDSEIAVMEKAAVFIRKILAKCNPRPAVR